MARPLPPVTLEGRHVRLEPLALDHVDRLVAAGSIDRSTYTFTAVPTDVPSMESYVRALVADHAAARVLPFVQRRLDTGEIVGCTRFMEPRWWRGRTYPDEIEIGGTWLAAMAQRTAVNSEAKLLLLRHAFEHYGVWRVAICTDARNQRSCDAIERLGASFEGILRNHRVRADAPTPTPRDSAMYSIVDADWPAVRDRLERRIAEHSNRP